MDPLNLQWKLVCAEAGHILTGGLPQELLLSTNHLSSDIAEKHVNLKIYN